MTISSLKIATWNVNSLRVHLPHVLSWLSQQQPDVLALQETKLLDDDFPFDAIKASGYTAIASGQKTYNGVALLIKNNKSDSIRDIVTSLPNFSDPQKRMLGATINQVRIIDLYIPNGESLVSEKYQYKLNWLQRFNQFLQQERKQHQHIIVLGDFNIAPESIDVHDPDYWDGKILCSSAERQAFKEMLQVGFSDCMRRHLPNEKVFTWWDYRLNSFKRNLGLRIDHILASDALSSQCNHCVIDKTPRGWERPSDHAPVMAEFQLS